MTDAEFLAAMQAKFPKDVRVGKLGIVRLKGKALAALRLHCGLRDGQRCVRCHTGVFDDLPDWHDQKYHMAHWPHSRGAGASDLPSAVQTNCGKCHRKQHGGKEVCA